MHSSAAVLVAAALVRIILTFYGAWQDASFDVKYTDIDYEVVTDAARHVATGGSPYERHTFRYTPLLAYLLLPNITVHKIFGKLLFAAADIAAALLLLHSSQADPTRVPAARSACCGRRPLDAGAVSLAVWLFNPYTATISTRGSSDALVTCMQLLTLHLLRLSGGYAASDRPAPVACDSAARLEGVARALPAVQHGVRAPPDCAPDGQPSRPTGAAEQSSLPGACACTHPSGSVQIPFMRLREGLALGAAGAVYGLLVHWRVFPVIYGPSLVLHLWHRSSPARRPVLVWTTRCLVFGVAALAVFCGLGLHFHQLYGAAFLHETFLYHAARHDPRHNFSPHFLFTYLRHFAPAAADGAAAARAGLAWWQDAGRFTTALTAATVVGMAARYARNLDVCWLLTTIAFVAFNKVSTAQYFVWYLGLLPLVLPRLAPARSAPLVLAAVFWLSAQLNWLAWAYLLEFQGQSIHVVVWINSLIFLVAHTGVILGLMRAFEPPPRDPAQLQKKLV